jgi:hypothetical protein
MTTAKRKRCPCGKEWRIDGQGYGLRCKAVAQKRYRDRRRKERLALVKQGVVPARVTSTWKRRTPAGRR